jgi:hypothetical protein
LTVCRRQQNDLVDQIWARWEQLKSDGRNVPPYPSKPNRFCTSDHKRGPIRTVMTKLVRELDAGRKVRILNCVGLRAEESSDRAASSGGRSGRPRAGGDSCGAQGAGDRAPLRRAGRRRAAGRELQGCWLDAGEGRWPDPGCHDQARAAPGRPAD